MSRPVQPLLERVMRRVRVDDDGCWTWFGNLSAKGYGLVRSRGKNLKVHRIAYEASAGKIPDGMQIDHVCRNRACVNPAHLEAVSSRENTMRGIGLASVNASKTHCVNGHPLSGENLRIKMLKSGRVERVCRECRRAYGRKQYAAGKP